MKRIIASLMIGFICLIAGSPSDSSENNIGVTLSSAKSVQSRNAIPDSIQFVTIPAGSFRMGSSLTEGDTASERPVHSVVLPAFFMSAKEITQEQFVSVMGVNPSVHRGKSAFPVERVSWIDAARFCNRLSDAGGLSRCYDEKTWKCDFSKNGYRLPTEAEWEYACRATTTTEYHSGQTEGDLSRVGWYQGNCIKTQAVGLKDPNAWGLYDMHGNVWELCNDWYDESYYGKSPEKFPVGPGMGTKRVLRGGSWTHPAHGCRAADRWSLAPEQRFGNVGFRVVHRPSYI